MLDIVTPPLKCAWHAAQNVNFNAFDLWPELGMEGDEDYCVGTSSEAFMGAFYMVKLADDIYSAGFDIEDTNLVAPAYEWCLEHWDAIEEQHGNCWDMP